MRVLLAQNALYYPAHGGGEKSNRLLLEALAARGHQCRAVARIASPGILGQQRYLEELAARGVTAQVEDGVVRFERAGVEVYTATLAPPRACFTAQAQAFQPEAILASTDDPSQTLLAAALAVESARVVYLARATLALPFGPDAAFPSESKTARIRACGRVVGVSRYVADYMQRYASIDAVHVPISLVEREAWPALGRFDNELVAMVNPCAVKGIDIFLALADAFPSLHFAAVPTWGTNQSDRAALASRQNIQLLPAVDDIDVLFARTRVLLAPSVWAEARSRIVLEAMLRGIPVMASDVGGIPEAKMGIPYLLPVTPVTRYQPRLDEQMVPVAEVPPQEIGPWRQALGRLTIDRDHYEEIARASRAAALAYVSELSVEPFERLLLETPPGRGSGVPANAADQLSPEKRKLLAIRLRKRAAATAWFPGVERANGPRLFSFPHAGGGASFALCRGGTVPGAEFFLVPVRLPGRESRHAEAPFNRLEPLVAALATAIERYLDQPFAFFGHSMGAIVAFELARELRRRGQPRPRMLIASGARAPRYRFNYTPPSDPTDEELLAEVRRLAGTPADLLLDGGALETILPALRADTRLYRHYVYQPEPPLDCPIGAYGGREDANIDTDHLQAWAGETTASFFMRQFPGGHFYLDACRDQVLAALASDLTPLW